MRYAQSSSAPARPGRALDRTPIRTPNRTGAPRPAGGFEPGRAPGRRGMDGGWTDERSRRAEAGERGAARAHLDAQRGDPAHQREPRPRHRPARGRRQRPRADRRALRHDRDPRRRRRDRGVHRPRPVGGRAPAHGGVAARAAVLRAPPGPAGRAAAGGPAGLPALARLCRGADAVEDPAGDADAAPGGACRQLLSRREGRRAGVHGRGRGGPGAVRLAGGDGDRQRPHAPRRAAGPGRPGGPGRPAPRRSRSAVARRA